MLILGWCFFIKNEFEFACMNFEFIDVDIIQLIVYLRFALYKVIDNLGFALNKVIDN